MIEIGERIVVITAVERSIITDLIVIEIGIEMIRV
jgi:hypothetical protein